MGIIESWKSRAARPTPGKSADFRWKVLFEDGCSDELLDQVSKLQSRKHFRAAIRLLRAGVSRFQPWPKGEEKLILLEKQYARIELPQLQEKAETEFSALNASRLADLLDILGDRSGWQLWSRAAIEEDPCDPEGYLAVARSYLRRFIREEDAVAGLSALRYLTKACQLRPGHGDCLRDLATLLLYLRAPQAASKVLAPLNRAAPNDPQVIALKLRAEEIPAENTTNVQELFLRWETGVEPQHSTQKPSLLQTASEFDLWEIDADRSLVAHSENADLSENTINNYSVMVGTLRQALPRMGMGDFVRFTSRGRGGILMGQTLQESSQETTFLGHCTRASHEVQLSRQLHESCKKEAQR